MSREAQLRREIAQIDAVTAEFEAAAGDLLNDQSVAPSNAKAREEVIEMLGVNYVGPEVFNRIFETKSSSGWFKDAIKLLNPFKNRVIAVPFEEPQLDFVKLKEILNEPDEWESGKRKFETYALVFKPPRSFLELKKGANKVAKALGKTRAFNIQFRFPAEAFATEVPNAGSWELVRRETVPGSTDKDYDDQQKLIVDKPNLVPTSFLSLASLLVGQYLAHDMCLYNGKHHYGRTSTGAASGGPVCLGSLGAYGAAYDDDRTGAHVGLAVSRNLN